MGRKMDMDLVHRTRNAPPRASALLESLRGLGYSTGAAIADIVDNSISAGAGRVQVHFEWDGVKSWISILDDGSGMTDQELENALRLGDRNPLALRASTDLGRFGMGLKTASFSQCRRLTVFSKKNNVKSCLRWDLDALSKSQSNDWLLFEGPALGSESHSSKLDDLKSGTLVLWELMDRVVTEEHCSNDFADLIDKVDSHLAMVFHRLIQGPTQEFQLFLNGIQVEPWDPFMSGHPAKPWVSPVTNHHTGYGQVTVQCHVLPHKDKLSKAEFDKNGGPTGWTSQQGFYVYRNKRLLVAGGWLGLGNVKAWNREEAHRLARIRVDIPNTADADWKIDVRKSTARPPVGLRPWLMGLAENTREKARRVFAYRGIPTSSARDIPIDQVWRVEHLKEGIRYKVDLAHPSVVAVLAHSGEMEPLVKAMLRVIEETVPVQRIWLDTAENKDPPQTSFAGEPSEVVIEVAGILFQDLIERNGLSLDEARKSLLKTEPFHKFPALIAKLGTDK